MDHPFDPILVETPHRGLPSGTCPRDPAEKVMDVCARCGDFLCLKCAQYDRGEAYCRGCNPGRLTRAEPGARFLGQLCDGLFYGVGIALGTIPGWLTGSTELILVGAPLAALVCFAINAYLLKAQGQSVGKRMVHTRIVSAKGGPAPWGRTLLMRSFLPAMISNIPGLGGIFGLIDALFIFGDERQCLHDRMADTVVVDATVSEHVYRRR
jgi:uncharacterized RDD family membrane protein YckC